LSASFAEQGFWVAPEPLLASDDLSRLRAIVADHVAAQGGRFADEIDKPHLADERLLEFLLSPPILDLVSVLCGPDIVLGSSHLFAKRPRVGKATPWHDDTAYLRRFLSEPGRVVNVWISVDGSGRNNGCMRVLPGSHLLQEQRPHVPVSDTERFVLSRYLPDVDDAAATDILLRPGQVSLHHPSILHSARSNTSGAPRTGLVGRFLPPDVMVYEPLPAGHKLWLARGRSHGKNTYQHWSAPVARSATTSQVRA
jgi:ectoine hydroxylase-related dioxygenase (phytanoyl-CoA dioxygenase family)